MQIEALLVALHFLQEALVAADKICELSHLNPDQSLQHILAMSESLIFN